MKETAAGGVTGRTPGTRVQSKSKHGLPQRLVSTDASLRMHIKRVSLRRHLPLELMVSPSGASTFVLSAQTVGYAVQPTAHGTPSPD
jgi:hypothetical protein